MGLDRVNRAREKASQIAADPNKAGMAMDTLMREYQLAKKNQGTLNPLVEKGQPNSLESTVKEVPPPPSSYGEVRMEPTIREVPPVDASVTGKDVESHPLRDNLPSYVETEPTLKIWGDSKSVETKEVEGPSPEEAVEPEGILEHEGATDRSQTPG